MPALIYPSLDTYKSTSNGLNDSNNEMQKRWETVKYIRFTPKTVVPNKKVLAKLKKMGDLSATDFKDKLKELSETLNTSKTSFRKSLNTNPKTGKKMTTDIEKSNAFYTIYLPMKPINISLSPSWTDGDASVFNTDIDIPGEAKNRIIGGAATKLASNMTYIQTILSQSGKYLAKPHRKYFSGVPGISLPFEWTFSPRSRDDFLLIKKIIKTFQMFSLPTGGKDENETKVFLRDNPAIWSIEYKNINGSNATNLLVKDNKFEFMVCTNIAVQYGSGDTWVSYDDGTPVDIRLSATFESFFNTSDSLDITGYSRDHTDMMKSIGAKSSVERVNEEFN